jgi:hypothetical protein
MNNSLALLYIAAVYALIFTGFHPVINKMAKNGPFKTTDAFTDKFLPNNYRINVLLYYLLLFCFVSFLLTVLLSLMV